MVGDGAFGKDGGLVVVVEVVVANNMAMVVVRGVMVVVEGFVVW